MKKDNNSWMLAVKQFDKKKKGFNIANSLKASNFKGKGYMDVKGNTRKAKDIQWGHFFWSYKEKEN